MKITITDIKKQKNDDSRYSVFIDERFAFGLSGVDLLFYKLEVGLQLTNEQYEHIIDEAVFARARDKAVRLLTHKARSRKELYERLKLYEDNFSEKIIEKVIKLMEKYGYIDDYKYTEFFIRDKALQKGLGKLRICYELRNKGIDEEYIIKAFAAQNINEYDIAHSALYKKYKGLIPKDFKERKKVFDFLLRKGFDYDLINDVLGEYEDDMPNDI